MREIETESCRCDTNKLGVLLMVGAAMVGAVTCLADEKTTIRDSQGRVKATVTTDRNGKMTYRDGSGRVVGTRKVQ